MKLILVEQVGPFAEYVEAEDAAATARDRYPVGHVVRRTSYQVGTFRENKRLHIVRVYRKSVSQSEPSPEVLDKRGA